MTKYLYHLEVLNVMNCWVFFRDFTKKAKALSEVKSLEGLGHTVRVLEVEVIYETDELEEES